MDGGPSHVRSPKGESALGGPGPGPPPALGALLQAVGELAERGAEVGHGAPDQGQEGPVYSSRTVNRVAPSVPAAKVKVRTPLNRPSGMPPFQVIRWPGLNSVTGKVRPGLALETTLIVCPGGDGALDPLDARVPRLVAGASVRMPCPE